MVRKGLPMLITGRTSRVQPPARSGVVDPARRCRGWRSESSPGPEQQRSLRQRVRIDTPHLSAQLPARAFAALDAELETLTGADAQADAAQASNALRIASAVRVVAAADPVVPARVAAPLQVLDLGAAVASRAAVTALRAAAGPGVPVQAARGTERLLGLAAQVVGGVAGPLQGYALAGAGDAMLIAAAASGPAGEGGKGTRRKAGALPATQAGAAQGVAVAGLARRAAAVAALTRLACAAVALSGAGAGVGATAAKFRNRADRRSAPATLEGIAACGLRGDAYAGLALPIDADVRAATLLAAGA